ncbi:hypothetical protein FKR81_22640 [Lentzea tibetensis]|uniref:Uncharacterized protein n=1 Tax=Lentzea tibetensis TaxID=2591470 RepID=A0A563ER40_9PSEU|nr:hypothetical protein [Lentzea tibetensis]TWP50026.1 hypothetical protein FKR81_22640 [Lentzea tibetensis]
MKPTIAVLVLLLAVGCGSAPKDKVASVSGDGKTTSEQPKSDGDGKFDEKKMLEFTKCMRDNGVDMPDPETDKGGVAMRVEEDNAEQMQKATEACKQFLPNGGEMRKPSPEEMDKIREQTKCMREKGYDMPDPDSDEPGALALPFDASEKTDKDMKDCGFKMDGKVTVGG